MAGCCGSATVRPVPATPVPTAGTMVNAAPAGSVDAFGGAQADQSVSAPDPYPADITNPVTSPTEPTPPRGGWSAAWNDRFTALNLAPADREFLSTAGYSDQQLTSIATALETVPELRSGDTSAATAAGANTTVAGSTATASAWNAAWESKFRSLLTRAGVSATDIAQQINQVKDQPVTETQLQQMYDQMSGQLGAWSPTWASKFRALFVSAKLPADQIDQTLASMAQAGMSSSALTKAYGDASKAIAASTAAATPGWNSTWENKFKTLQLPPEMVDQLKQSGAPESFLSSTFDTLLKTKMEFRRNGKLKQLEDAHANPQEKWGMMIEPAASGGLKMRESSTKDWNKAIEGIKSHHVSGWKRVASMALNFIPGVGALEYLTGKDWITGEKIDRSNPLNIAGAVLSAVAVVPMVSGISSAIKGASSLGKAAIAAETGVAGLESAHTGAMAANIAVKLGTTEKTAAALMRMGTPLAELSGIDKVKKVFDITKMMIPGVNRIGVAGKLSSMGRGFTQLNSFANTFSHTLDKLDNVAGGDRMKAYLTAEKSAIGTSVNLSAEDAATITRVTGMTPDEIIKIRSAITPSLNGEAALFRQSGKMWRFNPFANTATVESATSGGGGRIARILGREASSVETLSLGRGINTFGKASMSTADFAQVASRLSGTELASIGTRLGVGQGTRFRALAQIRRILLPGSEQAFMADASRAAHEGSDLFTVASRARAGLSRSVIAPSMAMLGAGLISGQMRQPAQAMWDYYKQKDELDAKAREEQAQIDARYQQETAALDQVWADYQSQQMLAR